MKLEEIAWHVATRSDAEPTELPRRWDDPELAVRMAEIVTNPENLL